MVQEWTREWVERTRGKRVGEGLRKGRRRRVERASTGESSKQPLSAACACVVTVKTSGNQRASFHTSSWIQQYHLVDAQHDCKQQQHCTCSSVLSRVRHNNFIRIALAAQQYSVNLSEHVQSLLPLRYPSSGEILPGNAALGVELPTAFFVPGNATARFRIGLRSANSVLRVCMVTTSKPF